jgi:NAD(P)-dependent dehydrogenase (short-subunit alcohol dehydrogenase family)
VHGNKYLSKKLTFFDSSEMNIVINGGTRGIGKEVVIRLSRIVDNQLLVTGRNAGLLKELSDLSGNIHIMVLDLSDIDRYAEELKNSVLTNLGSIDIIINIAGLMIPKDFMEINDDDAHAMMETNFFGPASAIRILKPFIKEGGHIVNISSMGGYQGSSKYRGLSYYSASKAALACLTECLSVEFSESGIKVNCLALGSVQTEMLEQAFPGYKAPVTASEMAEFISDFALKGHRYFNGKILPVAISNP